MGALYDMKVAIENKIKTDGLDAMAIKGQIGLRTGRILVLISPSTPDDPTSVAKLKKAAKELLNLNF